MAAALERSPTSYPMTKHQLLGACLATLALVACDEVTVGPTGNVASIRVEPGAGSLLVADTLRLVAATFDDDGNQVINHVIEWATSDPSVATVTEGGLVRGVSAGQVFVFAASGTQADSAILEVVAPLKATRISAGESSTCAVTGQGVGYCWGSNFNGNLGNGFIAGSVTRPTVVTGGLTWTTIDVSGNFGGHSCGLASGVAYCWGSNYNGQVGDGTTTHRLAPTPVLGAPTMSALTVGNNSSCGIVSTGVWCWPASSFLGFYGQPVLTSLDFGVNHLCGLDGGGVAYCWGYNYNGQLGDSTTINRFQPMPVAGDLTFLSISATHDFTCGLATGGTVYCWGYLGYFGLSQELVPTAVSSDIAFTAISAGAGHVCGLTSAGDAYCWGNNYNGELGDGTTIARTSPVPVLGGLRFTMIDAGSAHSCGIAQSTILYCWGGNYSGQIGDNTSQDRLEPAVVWAP